MLSAVIRGVRGVVASHSYAVGDIIVPVQKNGKVIHIRHSCRPTAVAMKGNVIANCNMPIGSEITIDYTAIARAAPVACMDCGAVVLNGSMPTCVGNGTI